MPEPFVITSKRFAKLLLRISIRGRVAMAAAGIEVYLERFPEYRTADATNAVSLLWEFTEIAEVWRWDSPRLAGIFNLATRDGVLYDMLENGVEIAREHLYTSISGEGEKETVKLLVENLRLLEGFDIHTMPVLVERLAWFSPARSLGLVFKGALVWGRPFTRDDMFSRFALFTRLDREAMRKYIADSGLSNGENAGDAGHS